MLFRSRKAERQAWRDGVDYDVPDFVDRTREEMAADSCWTSEDMSDGQTSLRVLTYAEVAAVIEAVEGRVGR